MGRATATTAAIGMMLLTGAALGQTAAPPPPGGPPPGGAAVAPPSPAAPLPGAPLLGAPPPGAPRETVLLPGIAEFQFSPRAWYLFESFGPRRQNQINSFSTSIGSDEYLLGGASVSARFNSLPETTFVLTGLYGTNAPAPEKDESSGFFTNSLSSPLFGTGLVTSAQANQSTIDTSRIDIEFLGVTAIPDSDWGWIVGGRFEHHASTVTGTGATLNTVTFPQIGAAFSTLNSFTSTNSVGIYTVKGGLAGAVSLTADNRLRLFGNIMAVAGFASPSSSTSSPPNYGVVGPDASIGLQYTFSPRITADARYRVMVYFYFDQPPGFPTNYTIYQGPMIGVNFKFN